MQRILKLQSKYVTNKIHHMHLYLKIINPKSFSNQITNFNKLISESCDELITLLALLYYFTLSNARRFYPPREECCHPAGQHTTPCPFYILQAGKCQLQKRKYVVHCDSIVPKYNHEALLRDIINTRLLVNILWAKLINLIRITVKYRTSMYRN